MANRSCSRRQSVRTVPARQSACPAEPVMRRWPHPVEGAECIRTEDPALHYIRCALSYQNQLLSDIKALLEGIAGGSGEEK